MIHRIYNGYWFWGRPSIADLWQDLRAVTSEIRPDWDLSKPGLREAWNSGDFSKFHGWDKRAGLSGLIPEARKEVIDAACYHLVVAPACIVQRVLFGGVESDGRFGCQIEESKGLLQIESNVCVSVTQVADGCVLAKVKIQVAASGSDDESPVNSGRPDDLAINQPFDVFEHRVAVVNRFG